MRVEKNISGLSKKMIIFIGIFSFFILVLAALGLMFILFEENGIGSNMIYFVYKSGAEKASLSVILSIIVSILLFQKNNSKNLKVILSISAIFLFLSLILSSMNLFESIRISITTNAFVFLLGLVEVYILNVIITYFILFAILAIFYYYYKLKLHSKKTIFFLFPFSMCYFVYEIIITGIGIEGFSRWVYFDFNYYLSISFLILLGISMTFLSFLGKGRNNIVKMNIENSVKI